MENFLAALTVRLRSHHGTFLSADDDDEDAARQDCNGAARSSRWRVELVPNTPGLIRLLSCHGRYLSASDRRSSLLGAGRKVLLLNLPASSAGNNPSVEWTPVLDGERIKLRSHLHTFLRANGVMVPYKGSVTHGDPKRTLTQEWVYWGVDVLELRAPAAMRSLPAGRGDELWPSREQKLKSVLSEAPARSHHSGGESSPETAERVLLSGRAEGQIASPKPGERRSSLHIRKEEVASEAPARTHRLVGQRSTDPTEMVLQPGRAENRIQSPATERKPRLRTSENPPRRRTVADRSPEPGGRRLSPHTRKEEVAPEAPPRRRQALYDHRSWESGSESSSPGNSPVRGPQTPLLSRVASVDEGRVIHYYVVDEKGEEDYDYPNESFTFHGSSVEELTRRVEQRACLRGIVLCIRDVINGNRLRRLQLQLPPNRRSMAVVAVPSSSPVSRNL